MADARRLRGLRYGAGFPDTLEHRRIDPGTDRAKALAAAIRRLRSAERLPLNGDAEIEIWGAQRFWAHAFASRLWLYYVTDPSGLDEYVLLMAVHDYLHEQ